MAKHTLPSHCVFTCGPYQGYSGRAEYEADDKCFSGVVIGVKDVITFVGETPPELEKAFVDSVDDYLAFCKERGESPDKPYSGQFLVRMPSELHRSISGMAELRGESLNSVVIDAMTKYIDSTDVRFFASQPSGESERSQLIAMQERVQSKLQARVSALHERPREKRDSLGNGSRIRRKKTHNKK